MVHSKLQEAARRFEGWLVEDCLPLWAQQGICVSSGGHYEKLTPAGQVDICNIRVRVQARQVFSFAVAYSRGWLEQGLGMSLSLMDFAERKASHPDNLGFTHLLNFDFEVIDFKQDLYDHAFFFLAYAWMFRVTDDSEWLLKAERLLAHLDGELGALNGGWYEGDYDAPNRRQNPHMHLFEAFMALYEASGNPKWLARSSELFRLLRLTFLTVNQGSCLSFSIAGGIRLQLGEGLLLNLAICWNGCGCCVGTSAYQATRSSPMRMRSINKACRWGCLHPPH